MKKHVGGRGSGTGKKQRQARYREQPKRAVNSAAGAEPPHEVLVGERIRDLRKARSMSLQDLAQATGLSTGYLSQIERNISGPSFKALTTISRTLGVSISWFLQSSDPSQAVESNYVVRSQKREILHYLHGFSDQLATPTVKGQLILVVSRIEPGSHTSPSAPTTHGGEEAGYVLEGTLTLWIDQQELVLHPGDSYWFPRGTPHRYVNDGRVTVVLLVAQTSPFF